jgi:hypothetical protein
MTIHAAELSNETGKLESSTSAAIEGFEDAALLFEMSAFDAENERISDVSANQQLIGLEKGIEGDSALRFPANWQRIRFNIASVQNQFLSNRVEVRFWTLPMGTKLLGRITWAKGNTEFGSIHFNPTGRITDDGWIEMSSGQVDFNINQAIQIKYIDIINDHFQYPIQKQSIDGKHYAWLDAVEIIPVGAPLVSNQSCRVVTEKEQCGQGGSCLLGRCVDSAFVWGNVPSDAIRGQAVDRFIAQNRHIVGIRKSHHNFSSFVQKMTALKQARYGQDFWNGKQDALQALEDGHLNIPIAATHIAPNTGFCINAGIADLLPGQEEPLPMVFNHHNFVDGTQLKPGDI